MLLQNLSDAIEASHDALAAITNGDVETFIRKYSDADDGHLLLPDAGEHDTRARVAKFE